MVMRVRRDLSTIAAHDPACNARLVQVWSRNQAQHRLLSVLRMVVVLQATPHPVRIAFSTELIKAIRTEVWFARLARLTEPPEETFLRAIYAGVSLKSSVRRC